MATLQCDAALAPEQEKKKRKRGTVKRSPNAVENNRRYRENRKSRASTRVLSDKRCCTCKETKPAEQFHNNKSEPDGLATRCKTCKSAEHRGTYVKRLGRKPDETKFCRGCNATKGSAQFSKQTAAKSGLTTYCKACDTERALAYYAENREHLIKQVWLWQRRNPESAKASHLVYRHNTRAREAGTEGSFTLEEWREQLAYFGDHCAFCARHSSEVGAMTAEHIQPLSRGGSGYICNIVPACGNCNYTKHDKTILEFVAWLRDANELLESFPAKPKPLHLLIGEAKCL